MMTYMMRITAAIAGLDKWQLACVSAMCAQSLSPIVRRFAQSDTRQTFNEGLDAAWKSVCNRALDSRIESARAALDIVPESTCDDSNTAEYDVAVAIGVLAYALDTIIENDPTRSAREACTTVTNSYSGYDYVISQGNQPRMIDPRIPPSPGRLETLQIQLQLRSIEGLRSAEQLPIQVLDQMRSDARHVASELELTLPTYTARRGWNDHPI